MNHEAGLCRNNDSSTLLFEFYCCENRLGARVFTQPESLSAQVGIRAQARTSACHPLLTVVEGTLRRGKIAKSRRGRIF